MDVATFQTQFPAFRRTDATLIQSTLARAARWVSRDVWGDKTDDGVALLAAHWLLLDPLGSNTAILKPSATTTYGVQFEEMRSAVVGGLACAGMWGGSFPGGRGP